MEVDTKLTTLEKILYLGAPVKPGEGRKVAALFFMLFMLLLAAYIFKPVREELILVQGGSEVKSYAAALQALVLLILVPIYGHYSRLFSSSKLMLAITAASIFVFLIFVVAGSNEYKISVLFYVWLGAYSVLILSQFWAYASEYYSEEDGKRLFGLIAFGASSGAITGSVVAKLIPSTVNTYLLMAVGITVLIISVLPVYILRNEPCVRDKTKKEQISWTHAFELILNSRFLLLIAVFALLLNWSNTLGEYLVSVMVEQYYDKALAQGVMGVSKNAYVRDFYSDFYLFVNICSASIQFFIVSRALKNFGVKICLVFIPLYTFLGYSLLLFFPVILFFKVIKIIENSIDYSLTNTVKQVLYLPTSREERYEARVVIETLGVRFGDMLQGVTVFVGLNIFMLLPQYFLFLMIFFALLMIVIAKFIGVRYQELEDQVANI